MPFPSAKSLPSPGRREQPAAPALSSSLSRRLRKSGSIKGGQSPGMFLSAAVGTGGRKKNGSFESAEPTSPKVTCIGQVRVKTTRNKMKKKQNKGAVVMRSRSRMMGTGEMSFRRPDQRGEEVEGVFVGTSQNQKWVHFPLGNICEAVKSFGSEINCFSPCNGCGRLSSSGAQREKLEKRPRVSGGGVGSCGTAFARWLMAIEEEKQDVGLGGGNHPSEKQDVGLGEGKHPSEEQDVGLGGENDPSEMVGLEVGAVMEERRGGSRREVMREMELVADELERRTKTEEIIGNRVEDKDNQGEDVDVLVCVPPRNALLLMRCRSDPVRMSSMANRFWGSPVETEGLAEKEVEKVEEDQPSADVITGGVKEEDVKGEDRPELEDNEKINLLEEEEEEEEDIEGKCEQLGIGSPKEEEEVAKPEEAEEKISPNLMRVAAVITKEEEEEKENIDIVQLAVETVEVTVTLEPNCVGEKKPKKSKKKKPKKQEETEERRWSFSKEHEKRRHSFSTTHKDVKRSSSYREKEARRSSFSFSSEGEAIRRSSFSSELEIRRRRRSFSSEKHARRDVTLQEKLAEDAEKERTRIRETQKTVEGQKEDLKRNDEVGDKKKMMLELPDCLLLMMYEPKLSMEVSKETWVSTADFIRSSHHHHRRRDHSKYEQPNKLKQEVSAVNVVKEETVKTVQQEQRVAAELVKTVRQKQANNNNNNNSNNNTRCKSAAASSYGPFVLTRCKSEPMRTSAKMLPDACFWKSRHQTVSTAGIGF